MIKAFAAARLEVVEAVRAKARAAAKLKYGFLPLPPLPPPQRSLPVPKTHLVMGVAIGYTVANIHPFLSSLKAHVQLGRRLGRGAKGRGSSIGSGGGISGHESKDEDVTLVLAVDENCGADMQQYLYQVGVGKQTNSYRSLAK
jgi:hypothetical protein